MTKHAKDFDPAIVVRDVARENEDTVRAHGHALTVELGEKLPPIHGVERLVHEAVANLVTNAVKYTPDGGAISLRAFRRNDAVRIEVEDNGIGIAPEDQRVLFQEFVRIRHEDGRMANVPGSGLGLSIVRHVAESHGGCVGVASELKKGSTFFIELPFAASRDAKTVN
jgi:signal transduction histidine kinase